ncbi:MAG: DUF2784 domain-containing protein [Acidimicrobiaceae bacterium]|nr:DUF2784 domain-containing protein [Acidimicrobiaceae bacterium]
MGAWLLAFAIALAHGLLAVFIIVGAPLAVRWPKVMPWYLVMLVPTAFVNIFRLPCPLTVWEKHFWRLAGSTPYRGGFLSQYFVKPFHDPGLGPRGETVLLIAVAVWCLSWLLFSAVSRSARAQKVMRALRTKRRITISSMPATQRPTEMAATKGSRPLL